jgi:hypothetical protein
LEGGRPRPPRGRGGSRGRSPSRVGHGARGLLWIVVEAILLPVKIIAALLATLLLQAPSWACAGCRVVTADAADTTIMAGFAFSWGVVIMLAFVFSLFGFLGTYAWKTVQAVDARHRG